MWFLLAKNRTNIQLIHRSRAMNNWVLQMHKERLPPVQASLQETLIENSRLQGKMGAQETKFVKEREELEDQIRNLKKKMNEENEDSLRLSKALTSMLVVQLVRRTAILPEKPLLSAVAEWHRQMKHEQWSDKLKKVRNDLSQKGMTIMQLQKQCKKLEKQGNASRQELMDSIAKLEVERDTAVVKLERTEGERDSYLNERNFVIDEKKALQDRTDSLTKSMMDRNLNRLKKGINDFFEHQKDDVLGRVVANFLSNFTTWKLRHMVAQTKLKSILNSDMAVTAAWQPRLTVPFMHWSQWNNETRALRRAGKATEELNKMKKSYEELEESKIEAQRIAAEEKAFILGEAERELNEAKMRCKELVDEMNAREEERLRILKKSQQTNNKYDEATIRLQEERQQLIFRLVRSMRRQYRFRSCLVLLQRWQQAWRADNNPNSAKNLHKMSAVQNIQLRDEIAKSDESRAQALKEAENAKLEAAKETDTRKIYALRLKKVNFLSVLTTYDALSRLRLTAAKWALNRWYAAIELRPMVRNLESALDKAQKEIRASERSCELLEGEFQTKDNRIAQLEKQFFEQTKEKLDLEQRLHDNVKNTKVELGELEMKVAPRFITSTLPQAPLSSLYSHLCLVCRSSRLGRKQKLHEVSYRFAWRTWSKPWKRRTPPCGSSRRRMRIYPGVSGPRSG